MLSPLPIQCHDTFCLISFYMYGMMIRVLHSVKMCVCVCVSNVVSFYAIRCGTEKSDRESTHIGKKLLGTFIAAFA